MKGDKYDFKLAQQLRMSMCQNMNRLDVQNGQMEKRFGELHEYFRDEGYQEYQYDMERANKAIAEVYRKMNALLKQMSEYEQQLQNEA